MPLVTSTIQEAVCRLRRSNLSEAGIPYRDYFPRTPSSLRDAR